jgi:hypothetical protein
MSNKNVNKGADGFFAQPGAAKAFNMTGDVVEADMPAMRAMPLMAAPKLVQNEFRMPSKPSLGLARPGMRPGAQETKSRSTSFGVQKEWTGSASASVWDVRAEDLEMLPEDFPLERTHRIIEGVDASVVASRISDVLRSHSIEAEYDCKKARVKCTTSDLVSFRIRLYAGGENGDPVVVEIQRRCGSTSHFMHSCRAILNAAEGKSFDAPTQLSVKLPKPLSQMKCLGEVRSSPFELEKDARDALDSMIGMAKSLKSDAHILALENLVALTDLTKSNHIAVSVVSKSIALGSNSQAVRDIVLELMEGDVLSNDIDKDESAKLHASHVRQMCLTIFANALSMCSKDGSLNAAQDAWFAEHLLPSLVLEIQRAEGNANNACSAICCVKSLAKHFDSIRRLFLEYGGVELLNKAKAFGRAHHELLANESSRCLKVLEG